MIAFAEQERGVVHQNIDGADLFAYRPSRRRNRLDICDVELHGNGALSIVGA